MLASGAANQNNVLTSWNYGNRPGAGSIVTKTVSGGGDWNRVSYESTDGAGRPDSLQEPGEAAIAYSYDYNSSGELTHTTALAFGAASVTTVFYQDGQVKSRGGSAVIPESFDYTGAAFNSITKRTRNGYILETHRDGLGRETRSDRIVRDVFQEIILYDDQGRVSARSQPAVAGTLYEVHRWKSLDPDSVAHDTALSVNNAVYDTSSSSDSNRSRVVTRHRLAAPGSGSTQLWWLEQERLSAIGADSWDSAGWTRSPLQDKALTINGQTACYPLLEKNAGGLRTLTAEKRDRANRTITRRIWRSYSASPWRSVVTINGLPTTFTAPEQTSGATLYYSPLREPLAEASFESFPYWPRLGRDPATGQVTTRYLPNRGSYPWPGSTAIPLSEALEFYEYYPSSHANAGLLKKSAKPVALATAPGINSQSDAVYYTYDLPGNLTNQWGPGTYPQRRVYDSAGRLTQLHTWRSSAASGTLDWSTETWPATADSSSLKSITEWTYYGGSSLVNYKRYPDDGTGGQRLLYTYYTPAGELWRRWSQRGGFSYTLYSSRGYDAFGHLVVLDYSDSTPDVKFTYAVDSGRLLTHSEGSAYTAPAQASLYSSGFTANRVTTYATRADGAITSEILQENSETITLQRPYADSSGRQTGLKLAWGALGSAPELTYAYDSWGRLSTINALDTTGLNVQATLSRNAVYHTTWVTPEYGGQQMNSIQFDTNGRPSSTTSSHDSSGPLRWDRAQLAGRGRSSTADRWEYRYNSRGEVRESWKQFGASTSNPASGEIQAGT